jgi:superoxide dismutase, Fe-Mn family
MPHDVIPLPFKPPRLVGLSERLLASHYENNYGGAVRRLNALETRLDGLDALSAPAFEVNGLKREALIAHNSMVLHEVYFDGLGGSGGDPDGALAAAIETDFGGLERWRRDFIGMGTALAGGSGWVVLTRSTRTGRLTNQWAADHAHALAGGIPILALDLYEHAYHLDFGAKARPYIDAVMANLSWDRIAARFHASATPFAQTAAADPLAVSVRRLATLLDGDQPPLVLDVRLAEDFAKAEDVIATANHRDPSRLPDWAPALPQGRLVVVYCLYGFHVSREAVAALRARGVDARHLAGGIAAWRAMGGATIPIA